MVVVITEAETKQAPHTKVVEFERIDWFLPVSMNKAPN